MRIGLAGDPVASRLEAGLRMATFLNEPGPDSGPSVVDCKVDDKRSCLLMVPAGRVVAMNGISRR